ncbi:MAG: aminodeoxychorismate synthase component I [Spirochaetae bacterium HGW-Spirochaetae-5]|nr:MAG: aminodeoxychorismate synthase component I [Spirochaetae bacterium HGW-Spirochaetae-5]
MDSFEKISFYAKQKIPFIFIIDYNLLKPVVIPIAESNSDEILYNFNGIKNYIPVELPHSGNYILSKKPVSIERYSEAFNHIQTNQTDGNSYLTNLTFPTQIEMNYTLKDIFHISSARYKLWYRDQFVVFSPEIFLTIKDRKISSYPMKGTIDASIHNAENIILNNEKESAEHLTIVDLIRNDLSRVSKNVSVEKYRYIDKIQTAGKNLLQVSSEITGTLNPDYRENLGEILKKLLPAGSITGAPKHKTIEIIKSAEKYERGYYCGICGIFDGADLDSGVMIRYIEKDNGNYIFKSGGGITVYSELQSEYQEMIDKVNIPVN